MKKFPRLLLSAGAKAFGLGTAALTGWLLVQSVREVSRAWHGDGISSSDPMLSIVFIAISTALTALFAAGLVWISWRLWRRWSADTVRIVTGVTLGLAALCLVGLMDRVFGSNPKQAAWAWQKGAEPLLLILAAVVYRKVSRAVIRWAELEDPRDAHGHPAGHMGRVKAFCAMLGWSVWLSMSAVGMAMPKWGMWGPALGLGSIILGLTTYRITLWWMTPPTKAALPPGRGFEVLPVAVTRGAEDLKL